MQSPASPAIIANVPAIARVLIFDVMPDEIHLGFGRRLPIKLSRFASNCAAFFQRGSNEPCSDRPRSLCRPWVNAK